MKRIIVDYKKVPLEVMQLLMEEYPKGYSDEDVLKFKNIHGETIEALEVKTEEAIYLVKVGKRLIQRMEDLSVELDNLEED
jgi:hypothetical protein